MPEQDGIVKVTRSALRMLADRAGLDVAFNDDETATLTERARHPAPERAVRRAPETR